MKTYKQIKIEKTMDILDLICEQAGIDKNVLTKTLAAKIPAEMTENNYAYPGLTVTYLRKILIDDFGVDDTVISSAFAEMGDSDSCNIINGVFNHDSVPRCD